MSRKTLVAPALAAILLTLSCASSKDPAAGTRVLEAVVAEREHESTGSTAAGYQGMGSYYLVFDVREGQSTSRYRLEVTRQQFYRFPEGSHVKITLTNNNLVDIRSIE